MKSILFAVLAVVCLASTSFAQIDELLHREVPRFEIGAGASYLRDPSNLNRYGWLGSFGSNINKWFAVKGEVTGHYYRGVQDDNVHSVLAGPQFNLRKGTSRVTPWAHFLVGAQREEELRFNASALSYVPRTRFAMQPGGGLDVSLNSKLGLRFGADYVRAFVEGKRRDIGHYRLHVGFVFKIP